MTNQITLEEALKLVSFYKGIDGTWRIKDVNGIVEGNVFGHVKNSVLGNVEGNVFGNVFGTINGREWQFIETPKEKLQRMIEEGLSKAELQEALNQLEDN